jgi:hypothetical protein
LSFEKHRELTKADHVIPVEAADNIFDVTSVLFPMSRGKTLQPKEVEPFLRLTLAWRGGQNVYAPGSSSFDVRAPVVLPNGPKNLKDWKQFWGIDESGSIEGQVKYQGGNLISRLRDAPEKVTPEDFRLRPDSAGYKAGKDGKDLGADVDLVGPGQAYERWKKTPEYQQWLKDTKQLLIAGAVTPELDAAKRELAKWQGEWENPEHGRLIINGDRWSWHPKEGAEVVSTIKVVEVTDKMTHVLLLNTGLDGKVRTIQTILRVDGDTLHNCGTIGPVRPTEFANKTGYLYYQWKRAKK